MGVIYKITSPSGRFYIGKSKNLKKRIKDYRFQSKTRKSIIHDSIRSYGWEAHTIEIIEECPEDKLSEREIFWIKELNSYWQDNPKGMNLTRGGEVGGGPWMWDLERRKYFSNLFKGENGTFYGKRHTEETKKILSEKASKRNIERGINIPKWGVDKMLSNRRKSIVGYNNKGNFIGEFTCVSDASKKTKVPEGSIKDSVIYGSWYKGIFLFKHKTENYPLKIEIGIIKLQNSKRPVYLLNDDLEPVFEFPSSKEASEFLGIPKTTINRAAMYNDLNPIRSGHIFLYKDMYLEEYKLVS